MPVKPGGRLVELSPDVVRKVDEFLKSERRPEPDFTNLVNAILEDIVEKENFLLEYLPSLEIIAVKEESIYLKNKDSKKMYEVYLRENKPHCNQDDKDDCEHARYALALSQFGKLVKFRKNLEEVMRVNKEASDDSSKNKSQKANSDSPDSLFQTIPVSVSIHLLQTLGYPILLSDVFLARVF